MEHLHELKGIEGNPSSKEMDVERWVQGFMKNCLGYMASSGYSIRAQEAKGRHRPDLIILKGDKPILVIEVKRIDFDINKSDFRSGKTQINEYLNQIGNVKWGILTNGLEWKLLDFSNETVPGVEIATFELKEDGQPIDTSKKFVEELCYELLDFHSNAFETETWTELSKEATAFSPESLAKAILSQDVMKHIARSIRGEFEYKANLESLADRVHSLLEKGLDDSIKGWNETRAMEMHKYLKSQKRAARKSRKSRNVPNVEVSAGPVVPEVVATSMPIEDNIVLTTSSTDKPRVA